LKPAKGRFEIILKTWYDFRHALLIESKRRRHKQNMQAKNRHLPTPKTACKIIETLWQEPVLSITRFKTGLCHFVYDVITASGKSVVVRIARDTEAGLKGAVYWSQKLRPLGVPLPELLYADLEAEIAPFPFILLERLPGQDLGAVYPQLTYTQKQAIVIALVKAQNRVGSLPLGPGFGYLENLETAFFYATWTEVVQASLARSRKRIVSAGIFDCALIDRVENLLVDFETYLAEVRPVPFLDDTTTKNVMVEQGQLSGIVDVDRVCYGDPIWTIALTQMAFLSAGYDLDYIKLWSEKISLTPKQKKVLVFYSAIFCLDFMSELGQVFNQAQAAEISPQRVQDLKLIHTKLLKKI
jgi:hypothetical protein